MKKAISCILTAAMALSATAAVGCGEKEPEREKFEYVWRSTEFELRDGLKISSFIRRGDELFARASERVEVDGYYKNINCILTLDTDNLTVSEEELVLPDGVSLSDIAVTDNGFLLTASETDSLTGDSISKLYEYSGGELTELIGDLKTIFDTPGPSRFYTPSCCRRRGQDLCFDQQRCGYVQSGLRKALRAIV